MKNLPESFSAPMPPATRRLAETHRIIYDQLCRDAVTRDSETAFVAIACRLIDQGSDCLILGCTEVGMLLNQANVAVPVFDTPLVHCDAALTTALGE